MKMANLCVKYAKRHAELVHVEPTLGIVIGLGNEKKERKKMGVVVKSYPSKSNPGKMYNVMKSNDGTSYYCDCWNWKKNRTCKHLEDFLETQGQSYIDPEVIINVGNDETVESKILGVMNRHW